MTSPANPAEQPVGKTCEAFRLYADTHLKVLRQMTNFAARVAKEGVSLSAELYALTLEDARSDTGGTVLYATSSEPPPRGIAES